MKVNVSYDAFNSLIETAEIPINIDKSFHLELVDSTVTPATQLLELKAENTLLQEEIKLQMTLEEARQFNLLVSQFLRQL